MKKNAENSGVNINHTKIFRKERQQLTWHKLVDGSVDERAGAAAHRGSLPEGGEKSCSDALRFISFAFGESFLAVERVRAMRTN